LGRLADNAGSDRVEVDVPGKFLAIGILLYKDSLVSALKQMTDPFPLHIVVAGVGAVDMVKDLGQIGTGSFQKNMIMVVHQTIGMDDGIISLISRFKIG